MGLSLHLVPGSTCKGARDALHECVCMCEVVRVSAAGQEASVNRGEPGGTKVYVSACIYAHACVYLCVCTHAQVVVSVLKPSV